MTAARIISLPRFFKKILIVLNDTFFCFLSTFLSIAIVEQTLAPAYSSVVAFGLSSTFFVLVIFFRAGIYKRVTRYQKALAEGVIPISMLVAAIMQFTFVQGLLRLELQLVVFLIQPIFVLMFLVGSRHLMIQLISPRLSEGEILQQMLIYGAGDAGRRLQKMVSDFRNVELIGFLDDAQSLQGCLIGGLEVFDPSKLGVLKSRFENLSVCLAIPSLDNQRRLEIAALIDEHELPLKVIPSFEDLFMDDSVAFGFTPVSLEELFERRPVIAESKSFSDFVENRVLLVTGAGGSIGGELCRQIITCKPRALILFDNSEENLYKIHQELSCSIAAHTQHKLQLLPVLGSVQDSVRFAEVLRVYSPYVVLHAAAYKHVPIVELNVMDAIKNNVAGSYVVANECAKQSVPKVILISTDKAVRPTNFMGASKRAAELIFLTFNDISKSGTNYSIVRFGNVLNSSGSVVPKFISQIKAGGPVTVTHPEVTRYFMSIPEAAFLVLQAASIGKGGEIFVLEMGAPQKISDLAKKLITLSGRTWFESGQIKEGIEIRYTGLRDGEKLHEELFLNNDVRETRIPGILLSNEALVNCSEMESVMSELLENVFRQNLSIVLQKLQKLVPEFTLPDEVKDLTFSYWSKTSKTDSAEAPKPFQL